MEIGILMREKGDNGSLKIYMSDIRKCHPMSREEEVAAFKLAKKGDQDAVERIIQANLRFVVRVALEYQGRGVPLGDLISEGNLGMLIAVKRFNENRGLKFITYAVWWIRQTILNALRNDSIMPRPANQCEDMQKLARVHRELTQQLAREPTLAEVAKAACMSLKRAERAIATTHLPDSLDAVNPAIANGKKDDPSRMDSIPDPNTVFPDDELLDVEIRQKLQAAIAEVLGEREAEVTRLYFGLDEDEPWPLEKIGKKFKLTRERIRQIRNRALYKLHRHLRLNAPNAEFSDFVA